MMGISNGEALSDLLERALGVAVVVKKKREIYYLGNVKFHLDELDGLGFFVEIEAGNRDQPIPLERLREQCEYYSSAFLIKEEDLIDCSYSDMLLTRKYAPF
jgi:predicted adenylyl cyclase CyaB